MSRKRVRAILFGPQGCGKGTQGRLLAEHFGVPLLGSGDLLRAEINAKTALGKLVKRAVDEGTLASDELTNAVMQHQLRALDIDRGFILDGYPRNVEQAEFLHKIIPVNLAIQIRMSDEEALQRLMGRRQCTYCKANYHVKDYPPRVEGMCDACGHRLRIREDDHPEIIRERLTQYHFMTEPLATYYRQRGVLLAVKGGQTIAQLYAELIRKMGKLGFVVKAYVPV